MKKQASDSKRIKVKLMKQPAAASTAELADTADTKVWFATT